MIETEIRHIAIATDQRDLSHLPTFRVRSSVSDRNHGLHHGSIEPGDFFDLVRGLLTALALAQTTWYQRQRQICLYRMCVKA